MNILLIGAGGQVGTELRRTLPALGQVVSTTRSGLPGEEGCRSLDVTDLQAVRELIVDSHPDCVVNASAYTAVDRAESERDLAFRVNAQAPGAMAAACADVGARFVHYSTDYVFAGDGHSPYRSGAAIDPQGAYGASKAAGEAAIRDAGGHGLILRTAWVYALHGQNFLRTMLRLGAERGELRVVADQVGSPTPAWLIADVTTALLTRGAALQGTRHLVARGETSWHGFAEAIFDEACARGLLDRRPRVDAITTADYPTPARRPAYSVLDPEAVEDEAGLRLPAWRDALAETFKRGAASA